MGLSQVTNDDIIKYEIGEPGHIASAPHQVQEWGSVEDTGTVGAAYPASKDVDEGALIVDNSMQDN